MAHRQPQDYRFESEIQADILIEFGSRKPMRVFRNNVGQAYPVGIVQGLIQRVYAALHNVLKIKEALLDFKRCRPVRYSVTGSADILGILMGGRALAIEVKMPGEKLRPEQILWRDMFIKFGGLYILATCIEDVYVALEKEGIHCR